MPERPFVFGEIYTRGETIPDGCEVIRFARNVIQDRDEDWGRVCGAAVGTIPVARQRDSARLALAASRGA